MLGRKIGGTLDQILTPLRKRNGGLCAIRGLFDARICPIDGKRYFGGLK